MPMRTAIFLGYVVHEDGRIWRPLRTETRKGRPVLRRAGWVATRVRNAPKGAGGGYVYVDLRDESTGKRHTHLVHRIVASVFIPTPNTSLEVNHKDGVRSNNHVSNLEWVSRSENQKHAYRTGIRTDVGEKHWGAKMSDSVARELHSLRAQGKSLLDLAAYAGINFRSVSRVLKGGHSVTRELPKTPDQRYSGISAADVWRDVRAGTPKVLVGKKYGLSRTTVWRMCKKEMQND